MANMTSNDKSAATKKSIWSDLPRRLATICIGFPLVWITLKNPILALIFFVGVHALVTWEYTALEPASQSGRRDTSAAIRRFGFILASLSLAHITNDALFHLLVSCTAGVFVWLRRSHWILGLLVITLPFRTWYKISQDFASTISILLVVWNCDTGALLFGRLSSKITILPRISVPTWIHEISPAKSMEGFIGGILGGTWTAVSWIPRLVSWFHLDDNTSEAFETLWQPFWNRVLLGMSMSVLAIVGDLVESSIKRQSQSKDSGSILPGHGGILDRFDSSLLAVLLYSAVMGWMRSA